LAPDRISAKEPFVISFVASFAVALVVRRLLRRCLIAAHLALVSVARRFAGGDAGLRGGLRIKESALQFKRREDFLLRYVGETCAIDSFDEQPQSDEAEIAIDDARTGRMFERQCRDHLKRALAPIVREQVERTPRG